MNKSEIFEKLTAMHQAFVKELLMLNENEFMYSFEQKWTAGQQLDHINRAVRPLAIAFMFPKFLLKRYLKKANRPSRTYDELVAKYHLKLQGGGRASGRFVPPAIQFGSRASLSKNLEALVQKLIRGLKNYTEKDLDQMVLPHPLLGRVTLREMLYFTIYHVQHHQELVKRNLQESNKSNQMQKN